MRVIVPLLHNPNVDRPTISYSYAVLLVSPQNYVIILPILSYSPLSILVRHLRQHLMLRRHLEHGTSYGITRSPSYSEESMLCYQYAVHVQLFWKRS